MADFRQLALEFVLADDESKLTSLAKQAATELQDASANTNPIARWVEAVQPWMPGANDDDLVDSANSPDWTARAKALEFLSRTLGFLDRDLLKPSQVKLLIGFFGAMFDVDHKAGVLPATTALSTIIEMKSFLTTSGDEIIQKVCALKDDFPRQIAKTRLAVYQLLRSLITSEDVSGQLKKRHGAASAFMSDLIQLCRNERDPNCLLVWFDTLTHFLRNYAPSDEIVEGVYNTFKAYFPITLPRASQSGITPDELKSSLRACFKSNSRLAPHVFPFLLGKMDQGDVVTVNVKLDVLKTIKACVEEYDDIDTSVTPYVDQIWGSLKYEVRNGEIEDTIWATLEVLKTFAIKLRGEALRDFSLSVTRDCVNDLSNAAYAASSGRLLVSVLSASPVAFVLMVSPTITHIKENLRHPKSPSHSRDLLRILNVILETRLLLVESDMSIQERSDFAAVDLVFKTLYEEVYQTNVIPGTQQGASSEDLTLAVQAVQGVGALVCQKAANNGISGIDQGTSGEQLVLGDKRQQVFQSLYDVVSYWSPGDETSRSNASDELLNETIKALQRAVTFSPREFESLVKKTMAKIQSTLEENNLDLTGLIQSMGQFLAFVGCSQLPRNAQDGWENFWILCKALLNGLNAAIEEKLAVKIWTAFAGGIQAAVRHFNDACLKAKVQPTTQVWPEELIKTLVTMSTLESVDNGILRAATEQEQSPSTEEIYQTFLIKSLGFASILYRKATKLSLAQMPNGKTHLITFTSQDFNGSDETQENHYLHTLGSLSGFLIQQMTEEQQVTLRILDVLHLFRPEFSDIHKDQLGTALESLNMEELREQLEVSERVDIFSIGILEGLRPSAVSQLFESGVGQELLIRGANRIQPYNNPVTGAVARCILTILANKHKIETIEPLMKALNSQADKTLEEALKGLENPQTTTFETLSAIAAGLLRRYSGKQAQGFLRLLKEAPKYSLVFARHLETVVEPKKYLTKETFASVKPLWMQKLYFELVKPLLEVALTAGGDVNTKSNGIMAVLLTVKHMPISIYEDDSENILRICLSAATLNAGASLTVLKFILGSDSTKGKHHLKSIITICVGAFSGKTASSSADVKLALEIVGGLPSMFEVQYLVPHRQLVERELAFACGHTVRSVRRTARMAREAWDGLK